MAGIADKVFDLIRPTVEEIGVSLWDVRFLKEGASHYLRLFIDKAEGVSIDDCTAVSHAVDPIIDEADPIDIPYYLEVCSCGIERELSRPEHFEAMLGSRVRLRLYKALDGSKEIVGVLEDAADGITVRTDDGNLLTFERKQISKANSLEEF